MDENNVINDFSNIETDKIFDEFMKELEINQTEK